MLNACPRAIATSSHGEDTLTHPLQGGFHPLRLQSRLVFTHSGAIMSSSTVCQTLFVAHAGEMITIRVAFKPTSTIGQKQKTVSRDGLDVDLIARGRHDPCVVPRAVPMVEAMVAIVLADQLLRVRLWSSLTKSCRSQCRHMQQLLGLEVHQAGAEMAHRLLLHTISGPC